MDWGCPAGHGATRYSMARERRPPLQRRGKALPFRGTEFRSLNSNPASIDHPRANLRFPNRSATSPQRKINVVNEMSIIVSLGPATELSLLMNSLEQVTVEAS